MTVGNHQITALAVAADLYSGAAVILLTEDGVLADRLVRAYGQMAIHAAQLADQLPVRLGRRILAVHLDLTGDEMAEGELVGEGDEQTGLRRRICTMSSDDRNRVALDIAQLAEDLDSEVRAVHRLSVGAT